MENAMLSTTSLTYITSVLNNGHKLSQNIIIITIIIIMLRVLDLKQEGKFHEPYFRVNK